MKKPQLQDQVPRRWRETRQPSSASKAASCAEDAKDNAVRAAGMLHGGAEPWWLVSRQRAAPAWSSSLAAARCARARRCHDASAVAKKKSAQQRAIARAGRNKGSAEAQHS